MQKDNVVNSKIAGDEDKNANRLEGGSNLKVANGFEEVNGFEGATGLEGVSGFEGANRLEGKNAVEGANGLEGAEGLEGANICSSENKMTDDEPCRTHENEKPKTPFTIEEGFTRIEEILSRMESEDASLAESFDLYKEGVLLVRQCTGQIDKVEKQIRILESDDENSEAFNEH